MRIRILHVLHSLQVGGLENGVVNLINNLDSQRFEHAICCIDSMGPMAERIKTPVSYSSLNKDGKRDYFIFLKIAGLIRRMKPDIVHTRNWSAIDGIIGAALTGHGTIIHGEHGREAVDPEGRNNRRRWLRKALSPWVSRFITVSMELKDWLIHDVGIKADKITQIINGVDTEAIQPVQDKTQAKSLLGLSPDTFVIGCVGRLDAVKDHETLFKAFRTVSVRNPEKKFALVIIGTGPLSEELKRKARELGIEESVIFTGQQDDMTQLYHSMDAYVLPSIAEGISNTILEAMASGLPVLSSSVGGNLELVQQERTGFFFAPGNDEELSVLMERYLRNDFLAGDHGHNGRQRAVNIFSLHQMTDKYAALYESCCQSAYMSKS